MKFATESKMKTWYQATDFQRKMVARFDPEPKEIPNPDWTWMRDHMEPIPNPYTEPPSDCDSDEDYFATVTPAPPVHSSSESHLELLISKVPGRSCGSICSTTSSYGIEFITDECSTAAQSIF